MKLSNTCALIITVLSFFSFPSAFADATCVEVRKQNGDLIYGDSSSKGCKGFLVDSWGWKASNNSVVGQGGSNSFFPLVINKRVDIATPKLMISMLSNEQFSEVKLSAYVGASTDGNPTTEITLTNAVLTSQRMEQPESKDTGTSESLTFIFASFCAFHAPLDDKGKPIGTSSEACWDIERNMPG